MGTWYCTRGDVKSALDYAETARNNVQVDRCIDAASRSVEGLTHRTFAPTIATKYFDYPGPRGTPSWRIWLDANEIISATTVTAGGTVIAGSGYFLEPANYGPPFNRIETNTGSSAVFAAGSTRQRAISILGLFGYQDASAPAGALAGAVNSSVTTVTVSNSALVDVGHVLRIDSERMTVTERGFVTTAQTLQTTMAASAATVTVAVTTGSAYAIGEVLLIDAERMLIVDVSGNNLTVKRAFDGSVLAAHNSGVTIYAPRACTVARAALGTTAASHLDAAPLTRWDVPAGIRELTIAEAAVLLVGESSGFARSVGTGNESSGATVGPGVPTLRQQVLATYGRKARMRSV